MNESQSIQFAYDKHVDLYRSEYRIRLNASIDCICFLLIQGLPFLGHDESENSTNKGNFLKLLKFYAECNDKVVSVVLSNALGNDKMIASSIQKDILHVAAKELIKAIIDDVNDDFFGIIDDESPDVSCKEQMALILRYVDKRGSIMERFLSASNMRGEFNGLKSLIMRETKHAYYIHYFAHQVQLALVFVAKKHLVICDFFDVVSHLLNVIGSSCKSRDKLREQQRTKVIESLCNGELHTSRGLNQELSIKRSGDTCWGSHYASLLNIMVVFSSIIDVLEDIESHGNHQDQRLEAHRLLLRIESFIFIFCTHLMVEILGKDQEIVNAMSLVKSAKERLQKMRDGGWGTLTENVSSFCNNLEIQVPTMEDTYVR